MVHSVGKIKSATALLIFGLLGLVHCVWGETTKTRYNPFTGSPDFIVKIASTSAGDLLDISTTGITNGQVIKWNSANSQFEPGTELDPNAILNQSTLQSGATAYPQLLRTNGIGISTIPQSGEYIHGLYADGDIRERITLGEDSGTMTMYEFYVPDPPFSGTMGKKGSIKYTNNYGVITYSYYDYNDVEVEFARLPFAEHTYGRSLAGSKAPSGNAFMLYSSLGVSSFEVSGSTIIPTRGAPRISDNAYLYRIDASTTDSIVTLETLGVSAPMYGRLHRICKADNSTHTVKIEVAGDNDTTLSYLNECVDYYARIDPGGTSGTWFPIGILKSTSSSGSGGGYAVEPATVTFQLDAGMTASTATISTMTVTSSATFTAPVTFHNNVTFSGVSTMTIGAYHSGSTISVSGYLQDTSLTATYLLRADASGTIVSTDSVSLSEIEIGYDIITSTQIDTKAELEGIVSDVADFAEADGDTWTGAHDFGGAGSLEIPNGSNPTVDAIGEIAVRTDVTNDFPPIIYSSASASNAQIYVVSVSSSEFFDKADGEYLKYDAGSNRHVYATPAGSGDMVLTSTQTHSGTLTLSHPTPFVNDFPKKRVFISATAGICRTSAGCTDAVQYETDTSSVNYFAASFANDADDYWDTSFTLPENYSDGATFTAAVEWTSTGTTGGVAWFVQLMSIGDDDALDTAFGTAIEVNDDNTASGDFLRTTESAAITSSGSPIGGDRLFVRVYRDVSDSDDDMGEAARFLGLWLTFDYDSTDSED